MSDNQATVKQLNGLIHLDYDAIDAYDAALKRVTNAEIRAGLLEFREDHRRHTEKLAGWASDLGGKAATKGDLKRILKAGQVAMASVSEDMGILKALQSNEEEIIQAYDQALERITEPAALVEALEHDREDEWKHKSWIDNHLDQTNQMPYPFTIKSNSH